jgi:hypothetical protein
MIHMSRGVLIMVVIALVIAAAGAMFVTLIPHAPLTRQNVAIAYNSNASQAKQHVNSSGVLFSSTQYFPYAYQVYPGPISSQAQSALTGFNLTSTILQNGTTEVTLAIAGNNQHQYIILKPDYKLYVVETTFGDDGFNFDSSFGDDGFVVVDPSGYIA